MKGLYLLTVITAIAVTGCDENRKGNGCKREITTTVTKTASSKNKIADFYLRHIRRYAAMCRLWWYKDYIED